MPSCAFPDLVRTGRAQPRSSLAGGKARERRIESAQNLIPFERGRLYEVQRSDHECWS